MIGCRKGKVVPPAVSRAKPVSPEFRACHAEPGRLNDAAVSPNFAERKSAHARAGYF
jgi:hypothetical protein